MVELKMLDYWDCVRTVISVMTIPFKLPFCSQPPLFKR